MGNPKQVKGIVPAKNGEEIGLANSDDKKFYKLDIAALNIWMLCDGKRSEDKVAEDFIKFLKDKSKEKAKIDEAQFTKDIKTIISKLKKYGLVE